jgi:hypothetical protein
MPQKTHQKHLVQHTTTAMKTRLSRSTLSALMISVAQVTTTRSERNYSTYQLAPRFNDKRTASRVACELASPRCCSPAPPASWSALFMTCLTSRHTPTYVLATARPPGSHPAHRLAHALCPAPARAAPRPHLFVGRHDLPSSHVTSSLLPVVGEPLSPSKGTPQATPASRAQDSKHLYKSVRMTGLFCKE